MEEDVITLKEAAKYLKVHAMTLYKMVKAGRMPAAKVGGQWRLRKSLINLWLNRKMAQNVEENDEETIDLDSGVRTNVGSGSGSGI